MPECRDGSLFGESLRVRSDKMVRRDRSGPFVSLLQH